jgi:hypothetical protein
LNVLAAQRIMSNVVTHATPATNRPIPSHQASANTNKLTRNTNEKNSQVRAAISG